MITVEMMVTKIEEGYEKMKAATFAYTSTAPMLTGTLVTIFGFWPIGFAKIAPGNTASPVPGYIHRIDCPWLVTVIFSPVIGVAVPSFSHPRMLKRRRNDHAFGSVQHACLVHVHMLDNHCRNARDLRPFFGWKPLHSKAILPCIEPGGGIDHDQYSQELLNF